MRNVIVTGGSRGLGLAIARRLCGAGYRVMAIARSSSPELETARKEFDALHFCPADLSEIDRLAGVVQQARKQAGPIYALVNNAGIGSSGLLATMQNSDIERTVRLNTISPVVLSKYVVRAMMVDGGGRIVNISSIVAATGFRGLAVYSATKASLVGFTKSLAREVGRLGINVNAVAPGFVDTAMTGGTDSSHLDQIVRRSPLHRLAEVDDVAHAVEFLLGEKSRNMTGTVLTVDAGTTA